MASSYMPGGRDPRFDPRCDPRHDNSCDAQFTASRLTRASESSSAEFLLGGDQPGTAGVAHDARYSALVSRSHQPRRLVALGVLTAISLVTILSILVSLQFGALAHITSSGTGDSSTSSASTASSPSSHLTPAAASLGSASATATEGPSPYSLASGVYSASTKSTVRPLSDLAPDLANYVAKQNGTMGVAIYDVTRDQEYGDNDDATFTLASSAKVYILCGYLDMLERQQRSATPTERSKMARMIQYSDNNAAQWLFNRLGGARGQQAFLQRIDIDDYVPNGYGWGWARLSPDDMVHILSLLQSSQILTPGDRSYALSLLGSVKVGRWGVGDTAPPGAQVYMKDGWVTGPDGKWAQNSSGIVVDGDETYFVSVYTAHNPRYDWSKVQYVCGEVGQILS